ncbi:hypothetical protein TKK_0016442 [Trichogramma kaykai]
MEGMELCESEEGNVTEMEQDEEPDMTQHQRIITELQSIHRESFGKRVDYKGKKYRKLSDEERNKLIQAQYSRLEKERLDLLAHEERLRGAISKLRELVDYERISVEEKRYDYFMINKCMQAETESRKRPITNDELTQDNSEEKRRRLL